MEEKSEKLKTHNPSVSVLSKRVSKRFKEMFKKSFN
jgi:hypothetical protein